jgi:metal-responsive CopG/Arc/MetJ family transcriptional regulator
MEENKEEYKRFTVSLPPDLYKKFEIFRNKLGISRSDGIRKSMHSFMIQDENILKSSGDVAGCLTLIMVHEHIKQVDKIMEEHDHDHNHDHNHEHDHEHDHEFTSQPIYANVQQTDTLLAKDIQHHFGDVIVANMHIHLEYEKCMEILAVSGSYNRINKLKQSLQKLKSVISIGFFVVDKEIEGKGINE